MAQAEGATRIGILGAGKMACALATAWRDAGLIATDSPGTCLSETSRGRFADLTGLPASSDNRQVARDCDVLLLAVKPHIVPTVLAEVRGEVGKRHLLISVAAGVSLAALNEHLGGRPRRLVRVMPNTPSRVAAGACGYAPGEHATPEDAELVERLFSAVGLCARVEERLINAVAGLSGSGPAYMFLAIEALSDGGVKMGLPRELATKLAAQTLLGAAKLALDTGHHPGELKDAVCSPGGTTIAAIHALEKAGFRGALIDAVEASARRSAELA